MTKTSDMLLIWIDVWQNHKNYQKTLEFPFQINMQCWDRNYRVFVVVWFYVFACFRKRRVEKQSAWECYFRAVNLKLGGWISLLAGEVSSNEKRNIPKTSRISLPVLRCHYLSGGVAKIENYQNYCFKVKMFWPGAGQLPQAHNWGAFSDLNDKFP